MGSNNKGVCAMTYKENLAKEIEKSGFCQDYNTQEKALGKSENFNNNNNNNNNNYILTKIPADVNSSEFEDAGYKIINSGIYRSAMIGDKECLEKLTNFVAWYDEKIINRDGINTEIFYKMKGMDYRGNNLPEILVLHTKLSGFSWLSLWNANCIIEPRYNTKEKLRHAIQLKSFEAISKTIFGYTGWEFLNNKWVFLYQDETIGEQNIKVELPDNMKNYSFSKTDNLTWENKQELIKQSFNLTKAFSEKVILPLLALAFLTPLNEIFRRIGYEPKFTYFIFGKTGCKKSTLTALILSFFGTFTNNGLPMSFLNTVSHLEDNCFILKDVLTCIDDYKPMNKAEKESSESKFKGLVTRIGDRVGRGRCNSMSKSLPTKPPRCNLIMTGEFFPNCGESYAARCLISELKPQNLLSVEELTLAQKSAAKGLYNSVMTIFIEFISERINQNFKKFSENLHLEFENIRDTFLKKLNPFECHPRLAEYLSHIYIGYKYMLKFYRYYNLIEEKEIQKLEDDFIELIFELGKQNVYMVNGDKPVIKFLEILNDLINSEEVYVQNIAEEPGKYPFKNKCIGYADIKNDVYYLRKLITFNAVEKHLNERNESLGIGPKTLGKQLLESKKAMEIRKMFSRTQEDFWQINKSSLEGI